MRDLLLGKPPAELDAEVSGLELNVVADLRAPTFRAEQVGKSFGGLKVKGKPIEISLPRTETKSGKGHKGFSVEIDPHLPFEEASARRDFTVNAMYYDPSTETVWDYHHGMEDLRARVLRSSDACAVTILH